jgi:N-sulfoglucosamine sulfohydrolase
MQELRRLHAAGQLSPETELFFRPAKPVEELFDTEADPHELRNLANDPAYTGELVRLRAECRRWMMSIGDSGLIHEAILDELKRPGGVMQQTAAPVLQPRSQNDQTAEYAVISQWPGVSLAYAIVPRDSRTRIQPQWKFYSNGELIPLKPGQTLLAKGCRLGFKDSDVRRQAFGEPPEEMTVQPMPQHWRQVVDADNLLERLWQIKSYDGRRDAEALSAYTRALKDPSPAVRYWGLRGANNIISPEQWTQTWQETAKLLQETDPSPAVQVLAAGIRSERQVDPETLRFLARELNDAVQPSVQLTAAHALQALGEAARPVLPQIRKATSGSEYPSRVAKSIMSALERN